MSGLGTPAFHIEINPRCHEWSGVANGVPLRFMTPDPGLVLYVRGVIADHGVGAEMVDQNGKVYSEGWRAL